MNSKILKIEQKPANFAVVKVGKNGTCLYPPTTGSWLLWYQYGDIISFMPIDNGFIDTSLNYLNNNTDYRLLEEKDIHSCFPEIIRYFATTSYSFSKALKHILNVMLQYDFKLNYLERKILLYGEEIDLPLGKSKESFDYWYKECIKRFSSTL